MSDDDQNFLDAFPRAWLYGALIVAAIFIPSVLSGCDNGASRRQQSDHTERQIEKSKLERNR